MTLIGNNWYEIFYTETESVTFKFLDTLNGTHRCLLCDGTQTETIFNRTYVRVLVHGENCPC